MIMLDTNIIYNFLFETKLTDIAESIIRKYYKEGLVISIIIVNELLYVVGAKVAQEEYGIKGRYSFRKIVSKHGYPNKAMSMIKNFIKDFKVIIISDFQNYEELIETIKAYKLMPSDAQIAITCKYYRIKTIATFDEDFKRVPWLRVIP